MHSFEQKIDDIAHLAAADFFAHFGSEQDFLISFAEYLEETGTSIHEMVQPDETLRRPAEKDVMDDVDCFRWFFHFHSDEDCDARVGGHFHLFAGPDFFADRLSVLQTHLIAIELEKDGDLAGFFVPNQWVTDEQMRPVEMLEKALAEFDARQGDANVMISCWLAALTRFFSAEISHILTQRDQFLGSLDRKARADYVADRDVERICEWKVS